MKGILLFLSIFLLAIGYLFIVINIEVLAWYLADPDGLFGFIWFLVVSSLINFTLILLIQTIVTVFISVFSIERKNKKTWYQPLAFLFIMIILNGFTIAYYYGIPGIMSKNLNDKYKYSEQTDDYIKEGRYDAALNYGEKVYRDKVIESENKYSYLFIVNWYKELPQEKHKRANNRYAAMLNYANCLNFTNTDIPKSLEIYNDCIEFAKKKFPDQSGYQAAAVAKCFNVFIKQGETRKVDSCYSVLSKLINRLDKSDIDIVVKQLKLYANYSRINGDIESSSKAISEAYHLYLDSDKSKKNITFFSLGIANLRNLIAQEKYESAVSVFQTIAKISKKFRNNRNYSDYLLVKATFEEFNKEFEKAENTFKRIIKFTEDRQGKSHIDYANSLFILGQFYFRTHDYTNSLKYYSDALETAKPYRKELKTDYNLISFNLGFADFVHNRTKSSIKRMVDYEKCLIDKANERFLILSEFEKANFVSLFQNKVELINYVYATLNDSTHICRLFNNILAFKSIALQSSHQFRNLVMNSGNPKLINDYENLLHRNTRMTDLKANLSQNFYDIDKLKLSIRKEYQEIKETLENTQEYHSFKINSVKWRDVQLTLNNDETVIEFLNISFGETDSLNSSYYALVLSKSMNYPHLVYLFDESDIETLLKRTGRTYQAISNTYCDSNKVKIKDLIFNKLCKYLSPNSKVFFSLSGILYQISIPSLLIDEKFDFSIINSSRELAFRDRDLFNNRIHNAVLYGGIDYGEKDLHRQLLDSTRFNSNKLKQSVLRSGYNNLPATLLEIDEISEILTDNNYKCESYYGHDATEASLKNLSNSKPEILHIATHAFYFPAEFSYRVNKSSSIEHGITGKIFDPLKRSGLLMSGANSKKVSYDEYDGILTSFEISKIDLTNVDLAVLSACETGLGELKGYEGVFGLQRAFKLAGVDNLIISLWKVPDRQTAELMQVFYSNYMSGMPKNLALIEAQRELKRSYPNPFYWGAFTLIE